MRAYRSSTAPGSRPRNRSERRSASSRLMRAGPLLALPLSVTLLRWFATDVGGAIVATCDSVPPNNLYNPDYRAGNGPRYRQSTTEQGRKVDRGATQNFPSSDAITAFTRAGDIAFKGTQSRPTETPDKCIPIISGVGGGGTNRNISIKATGSATTIPTRQTSSRRTQGTHPSLRCQSTRVKRLNPIGLEIICSNAFQPEPDPRQGPGRGPCEKPGRRSAAGTAGEAPRTPPDAPVWPAKRALCPRVQRNPTSLGSHQEWGSGEG